MSARRCQCKCHLILRIKNFFLLFTGIHLFNILFLILTIVSLQKQIIGICLMLVHLLFVLISSFFSLNFQKVKCLILQIIYFFYFWLTFFTILFNTYISVISKLNFDSAITVLPSLVISILLFLCNIYIIIVIYWKKKAMDSLSTCNYLDLCSVCSRYCQLMPQDNPPSYDMFRPPSYSKIFQSD